MQIFKFQRLNFKLSFLLPPLRQSAPESLLGGYFSMTPSAPITNGIVSVSIFHILALSVQIIRPPNSVNLFKGSLYPYHRSNRKAGIQNQSSKAVINRQILAFYRLPRRKTKPKRLFIVCHNIYKARNKLFNIKKANVELTQGRPRELIKNRLPQFIFLTK